MGRHGKQLLSHLNDQKTAKPEPRTNFPRVAPSNPLDQPGLSPIRFCVLKVTPTREQGSKCECVRDIQTQTVTGTPPFSSCPSSAPESVSSSRPGCPQTSNPPASASEQLDESPVSQVSWIDFNNFPFTFSPLLLRLKSDAENMRQGEVPGLGPYPESLL